MIPIHQKQKEETLKKKDRRMCGSSTCNDTIPRRDQGSFLEKERQGWVLKGEECIPGRERREPGVESYMEPGRSRKSMVYREGVRKIRQ